MRTCVCLSFCAEGRFLRFVGGNCMLGFREVCCLMFVLTSGSRCIEGMFLIFYCIFGYIVHCSVFAITALTELRMHWNEPPRPW